MRDGGEEMAEEKNARVKQNSLCGEFIHMASHICIHILCVGLAVDPSWCFFIQMPLLLKVKQSRAIGRTPLNFDSCNLACRGLLD